MLYASVRMTKATMSKLSGYNAPNVPCGCIVCVWVQTRNRTLPGFVHAARSNVYNYHVFLLLACHEHEDASGRSAATVSVGSRFLGK